MAKIIDNNYVWFQEVAPRSYYNEGDLERAIIHNLEIIFPEYKALPFKKKLKDISRNKENTPDLVMVKKDYENWYLIEVELGGHPVAHVVDQITTFYNCNYSNDHAQYIYEKSKKALNLNKLTNMINSKTPELMVIVNEPKPEWSRELSPFKCKSCVFQIYHNNSGDPLYRLEGEHPLIKTDFCHCKYQNSLPYVIEVLDKSFLDGHNIDNGALLEIGFKGKNFRWKREDSGKNVFLICESSGPPLDPLSDRYRLNCNNSTFLIKKNNSIISKFLNLFGIKAKSVQKSTFTFTKD